MLWSAAQVCRLSVAALGLLQYSQHVLSDEALYAEEKVVVILPNHLSVLHRVACEQPGMIPQVGTPCSVRGQWQMERNAAATPDVATSSTQPCRWWCKVTRTIISS